ncbi:hypothetical protein BD414DRAFT_329184 [Trametes punicea]|nr:hypothetical protein BD414DRAFT_329184 [Trametes punicea]
MLFKAVAEFPDAGIYRKRFWWQPSPVITTVSQPPATTQLPAQLRQLSDATMLDIPMNAIQHVWMIDEIVRNILAHLPPIGCSRTLVSCARVSKALSEPALDMLWSKMTGMHPLCELLPQPCEESVDRPGDSHAVLAGPVIDDACWSRFTHYARRVRKLHYHCREGLSERFYQRTFAALANYAMRMGVHLLPRLEEITWLQSSQDVEQYLHFLSPSLRRITIYAQAGTPESPIRDPGSESREDTGLLDLLRRRSPAVEELSLEGVELSGTVKPCLTFGRLRSLYLGSVTAPVSAILSYCATMPNLSSLSVDLTHSPVSFATFGKGRHMLHAHESALSSLQVLRVAGTPAPIEELILAVQSPSLRSISLSVTVPEHDRDGGARCVGLLTSRFAASLDTVRVEYRRPTERLPPPAPRSFTHYAQPLFVLRGLRKCNITVEDSMSISMTDSAVRAMAEAWPSLVSLEVKLPACSAVDLPSIVALQAFARCCPDLVSVRLPISQDVSALDAGEPGAVSKPCSGQHGLRTLWLSGVYFTQQDSRRVMHYLTRTFPRVDLVPMLASGVLRSGMYVV